MKTNNKPKRKKNVGSYREREKERLRVVYLIHAALLAAYLLLCGVFYAKNGSESMWHGEGATLLGAEDVKTWLDEKWDLFLDRIGDKIKP